MKTFKTYFVSTLFLLLTAKVSVSQVVNSISIIPLNPVSTDTIRLISNFSYYGNCSVGLVNVTIYQSGSNISILPEYCGFGESSLCNTVDTFTLGVLSDGNYTLNIEYHQGTVCGGGFDSIISSIDSSFQIGTLSNNSIRGSENEIHIYPNPTTGTIEMSTEFIVEKISLFDISGKETVIIMKDNRVDLHSLGPGFYILRIRSEKGELHLKKIVVRKN